MTDAAAAPSLPGTARMTRIEVRLSTLWIFAMFNYLYADVLTLMDSEVLKQVLAGQVGSMRMTRGLLFGAAVLMETAMAMVLVSRMAPYRFNRWANIVVGAVHTVVVALSLVAGGGKPAPYYAFCAIIEIACTAFIVGHAWRWRAGAPVATG